MDAAEGVVDGAGDEPGEVAVFVVGLGGGLGDVLMFVVSGDGLEAVAVGGGEGLAEVVVGGGGELCLQRARIPRFAFFKTVLCLVADTPFSSL